MKSDFLIAVTQLAAERNLPRELVLSAIEAALVSAYKKDNQTAGQNISVKLNPANGEIRVYTLKTVMEVVEDSKTQLSLEAAQAIKTDAQLGQVLEFESSSYTAGRIAAQTAKQVVVQRLREAERERVFAEYAQKEGEILTATVLRLEGRQVIVNLSRTEAVLPEEEQVPTERYRPAQQLKVYLVGVQRTLRGTEIVVSRTHRNLLKRLFELEVPEIYSGVVEIMAIAREPGVRSKVAVAAKQERVDPVGSCVGLRGIRIQNIVNELHGEKIDVVQWHRDLAVFIANSLSPAQALRVETSPPEKTATVVVADRQLSLAIGKDGQNARLATKLTGWKVDIKGAAEFEALRHPAALEAALLPLTEAIATEAEPTATLLEEKAAPPPPVAQPVLAPIAQAKPTSEALVKEEKPETATGITAEEALLREMPQEIAPAEISEAVPVEEAVEEETEEEEGLGEEVWTLPNIPQHSSGIRFAEEILGPRAGRTGRRGRRRGGTSEQGAARGKGRNQGSGPTEAGTEDP